MTFRSSHGTEKLNKVPRFEESEGFYTTKERSRAMSKVKSKNSKAELLLRKALWKKNIRFRLHKKGLLGCPDILIAKYKLIIFVDGDFWHGYKWEEKRTKLKANIGFWIPKIEHNIQRDKMVNENLCKLGYNVMRFWEHEIKKDVTPCVNQVLLYIEATKKGVIPDPW